MRICLYCNKKIKNAYKNQKYHKECRKIIKGKYNREYHLKYRGKLKKYEKEYYKEHKKEIAKRGRKYRNKRKKEYVKIPCPIGRKEIELVYANGVAQEIQKKVPELTQKIMLKLLNENEKK